MKVLVAYSGGKDSLASLIWAVNWYGKKYVEAVFCDTGWEHELTYEHIKETTEKLGVKLVTLKSKKYDGMVDMAVKKGRFPSTMARFCTEELKTKPMIDYILDDCKCHVIVVQGIRADESASRSRMSQQCSYFKYYYTPYGHDKNNKPKYHNYRKKDVLEFRKLYSDDVERPFFNKTGVETMQYILDAGFTPNPLYYSNGSGSEGAKRVGCFPCIMSTKSEVKNIFDYHPKYEKRLIDAESLTGRTFFPPDYIPERYRSITDTKSGKKIASVSDVKRYLNDKDATLEMFEDDKVDRRCMSYYGICE